MKAVQRHTEPRLGAAHARHLPFYPIRKFLRVAFLPQTKTNADQRTRKVYSGGDKRRTSTLLSAAACCRFSDGLWDRMFAGKEGTGYPGS